MTENRNIDKHNMEAMSRALEELRALLPGVDGGSLSPDRKNDLFPEKVILANYFFNLAGIIFICLDSAGTVRMCNPKACEILGYPESEIIGKNWFEHFLPERIRGNVFRVFQQLMDGGYKAEEYFENEVLTRNGEERLIAWRNTRMNEKTPWITAGCLSAGEDITERRRAEMALEKKEEQYRQLVENVNLGMMIAQNWVFKYANPKTCEILMRAERELLGKPFLDFIHPDDRDIVAQRHQRRLEGETSYDRYRVRLLAGDGSLRWSELKPIRVEWENQPATMVLFSDVTDQMNAEAERKKIEELWFQSQKMEALGTLAGGVAHDFNNILGSILGFAEMAEADAPKGGPVSEHLHQIIAASRRARLLVMQILDFSRKSEPERKPLRLEAIIRGGAAMLRGAMPNPIRIEMDFTSPLHPVLADETQLYQVIMNLGSNAIRAMESLSPGKDAVLRFTLAERFVDAAEAKNLRIGAGIYQVMTVSDTGCGMDEKIRARIFEPYFTTRPPGEGSGLGLAAVHGIVRIHKGAVSVESQPGHGASFFVFLPIYAAESPATPPETVLPAAPATPPRPKLVMLTDDEEALALVYKRILERANYRVESFTDSLNALDAFKQNPGAYDLIITDQSMPGLTGIQLIAEIKRFRPDIPVILCTGFSELVDEKNFRDRGVDEFIYKPFSRDELTAAARKMLEKSPADPCGRS